MTGVPVIKTIPFAGRTGDSVVVVALLCDDCSERGAVATRDESVDSSLGEYSPVDSRAARGIKLMAASSDDRDCACGCCGAIVGATTIVELPTMRVGATVVVAATSSVSLPVSSMMESTEGLLGLAGPAVPYSSNDSKPAESVESCLCVVKLDVGMPESAERADAVVV